MRIKFIFQLVVIVMLAYVSGTHAAPPPPPQGQGPGGQQPPFTQVSINDPQVIRAANYAAQQMKSGKLVTILSAQKQGVGDVNYLVTMEVLEANGVNKVYQVEVCIPEKNIPWRLKSVTAVNN